MTLIRIREAAGLPGGANAILSFGRKHTLSFQPRSTRGRL